MKGKIKSRLWVSVGVVLLVCILGILGPQVKVYASQTTDETIIPSLTIQSKNLSYSDSVYILYAVSNEGFDRNQNQIKMLFWTEPQTEYVLGTESYAVKSSGSATVKGKDCLVFYSDGLAAKEMTGNVYARACVTINGVEYYSETIKYSVLEYVYEMREKGSLSENKDTLFEAMLQYGAASQNVFNYHTERLANANYYKVAVENGVMQDGFLQGRYQKNDVVTITANPPEAGKMFKCWKDVNGTVVSTENQAEITVKGANTYTAVYSCAHVEEVDASVEATCTETGLTEGKHCSVCEEILVAQTVIPAKGHTEVIDEAVEATCAQTGLTEGKHCSVCNEVLVAQKNIDALDHRKSITTITEKTITVYMKTNSTRYPFSVSGNQITSTNKAKNSSSTYTITAAQAFTLELQYMVSSEASYDELSIKHNATTKVTASGYTSTTYKTLTISMMEGDTVTITYSKDDSVNKGDDCAYVKLITSDTKKVQEEKTELIFINESNSSGLATCAENILCDECGQVAVEKLPHTEGITAAVPPTCGATGLTEGKHCSVCGEVLVAQEVVDATGEHIFGEWVTTKAPTSKEEGLMERTCACGESETQAIDKIIPELVYTLNSDKESYSVTGIGTWDDESLVILNTHNNLPITGISASAFKNCTFLTSVVIPDSVTSIGDTAFYGCTNLKTINIPDDITSIGNYAFDGCNSLAYNQYGNAYYLGNSTNPYIVLMKATSTSITSCTIHKNTKVAYHYAFSGCSSLAKVYISDLSAWCNIDFKYEYESEDGVRYYYCSSNPLSIAGNLYVNNIWVKDLVIPEGVTEIKDWAFYKATFNKLTLPSTLTEIGVGAFKLSELGGELIIPEGVTYIGDHAFYGCSTLSSVTMPVTLTSVGDNAFRDCSKLNAIHISDLAAWCAIHFSWDSDWDEGYWQDSHANPLRYAHNLYLNGELITDLLIPDSVTALGDYVFYGAYFDTVTLPEGITYIPDGAFRDCTMQSIYIPDSVTSIGYYAFTYCSNLKILVINNVTKVYDWALWGCNSLSAIYSINSPGISSDADDGNSSYISKVIRGYICVTVDGAIYGIKEGEATLLHAPYNVSTLDIPSSIEYNGISYKVTSIGEKAFYGCTSLTGVTIPDSVTSIGTLAFYNCRGLTSITIPDSVTSIGNQAFQSCRGLTSITIPDSVTSIGNQAFYDCTKLVEVINKSNLVITAGTSANGYVAYYAIEVHNGTTKIVNQKGYLFYTYEGVNYLLGYVGGETSLTLPENYNGQNYEIYDCAFYHCSNIANVTIGDSVTSIGESAFEGCSGLTSITIPDSVTSIGNFLFRGCSGLASITIPASVMSIGNYAFEKCIGLISITIPDSVTSIGNYAFSSCSSLASVIIGNGVTSMGNYAFSSCSSLTSVSIGNGVMSMGNYAFSGCSSLTSVSIGNGVTSIGSYAFEECIGLTSITIPDSVTSIGYSAFNSCSNLTSVTIGNGVTSIESSAFQYCFKLVEVINKSKLVITAGTSGNGYVACYAIEVHDGTTKIVNQNDYLFYICERGNYLIGYLGGETSLTLPENYNGQNYEIYNYAFYECKNFTSITIPDSVTSIGDSAFAYCSNLTGIITVPDSVTSIGRGTFYSCWKLTSIVFEETTTWYRTSSLSDWESMTGGTSTSVTNASTNATYFNSTYYNYYWYKK